MEALVPQSLRNQAPVVMGSIGSRNLASDSLPLALALPSASTQGQKDVTGDGEIVLGGRLGRGVPLTPAHISLAGTERHGLCWPTQGGGAGESCLATPQKN